MDFTRPTPSRGIAEHWQIAATRRLACDLVVALDVVDRFCSEYGLREDQVLSALAAFEPKWLALDVRLDDAVQARLAAGFRAVRPYGPLILYERISSDGRAAGARSPTGSPP